ncbi:MAG: LysE family translocator [Comamonas sp.]|nr:LysE family translocator [Comamonas sp.]
MALTSSLSPVLTTALAMVGFALAGAITPGPVNVLALHHGSRGPRLPAFGYVLGASLSYALIVACMGLFAAQLALALPRLARTAQWLCAAYLLWLAWKLASAPADGGALAPGGGSLRPWRAFGQGVAVQTLNPKAWLFALSAVGVFALPPSPSVPYALAMLCAVSLLACLVGVGCWALLGRALVRWLGTPQRTRLLHRALAAVLLASVLGMLA